MTEEKEEKHEPGFTGWWFPADIVYMFDRRELTLREMALLAIVDSLVNRKTGVGCFASNEYLGRRLQISEDTTSDIISTLKSKGLLKQTKFDGRKRWLETCWSRVCVGENPKSDSGEEPRQHREKSLPYSKGECKGEKKDKDELSLGEERQEDGSCSCSGNNGFHFSGENNDKKPLKYSEKQSIKLYNALAAKRKVLRKANLKDWAWWIDKLFKESDISEERFSRVMGWYIGKIGEPYVPHAFSTGSFCEKFIVIETQMEIQSREQPSEKDGFDLVLERLNNE